MAVYAVGGEADTYTLPASNAFAHESTSGRYEANASRNAMLVTAATSEISLPFNTSVSTAWVHVYLYHEAAPASNVDYILIQNAAGTETEYKIIHNTDSTWTIQRFKSAAFSSLGTTAAAVLVNAAANIDIEIVRHLTTGIFRIYKDGVQIFSFTGDTDTDSTMGRIRFVGTTTNTREANVSQVIVADENTIGWKLATLSPDGNGANTSWTNDYTAIDESVYNAGDFIETNTLNQLETSTVTNINAAYSTYNVKAVVVAARASNDSGSAINDIQGVVRVGATNYTSANLALPKDGLEYSVQTVFTNNPATATAWTQAEVNALEAGVKSV
jgi:hypothetical protein